LQVDCEFAIQLNTVDLLTYLLLAVGITFLIDFEQQERFFLQGNMSN